MLKLTATCNWECWSQSIHENTETGSITKLLWGKKLGHVFEIPLWTWFRCCFGLALLHFRLVFPEPTITIIIVSSLTDTADHCGFFRQDYRNKPLSFTTEMAAVWTSFKENHFFQKIGPQVFHIHSLSKS